MRTLLRALRRLVGLTVRTALELDMPPWIRSTDGPENDGDDDDDGDGDDGELM